MTLPIATPGAVAGLPRVHIVIPTHTTRHLATCLSALSQQSILPASVVVSCDTDEPEIGRLLDQFWPRIVAAAARRHGDAARAMRLIQTSRARQPWAHPAQVRNNGFRALDEVVGLRASDRILGLDGDIVLSPDAVQRHAEFGAGADVVLCFCIYLSKEATESVTAESMLSVQPVDVASLAPPGIAVALDRRHRRFERHLAIRRRAPAWMARLLVKEHKPKVISGHFSVRVDRYRAINGFDEEFTQYGYEDDDVARRLHAIGASVRIAVRDIIAYHLAHPSRAPKHPVDSPGWVRFRRRGFPAFAIHGIVNPVPQDRPIVRIARGD